MFETTEITEVSLKQTGFTFSIIQKRNHGLVAKYYDLFVPFGAMNELWWTIVQQYFKGVALCMNPLPIKRELQIGDYVLATKYHDGDPQDQWCIGFYHGRTPHKIPRHDVVDSDGKLFRNNGFRRVKRISEERGQFILDNKETIQWAVRSLWWWARCPMK